MSEPTGQELVATLAARASYDHSCYHRHNTTGWRPDKSKCPPEVDAERAEALLMEGIGRSMFSAEWRGDLPQNVWAVDEDGLLYEAQLTNREQGQYHGYPVATGDRFAEYLRAQWEERA